MFMVVQVDTFSEIVDIEYFTNLTDAKNRYEILIAQNDMANNAPCNLGFYLTQVLDSVCEEPSIAEIN